MEPGKKIELMGDMWWGDESTKRPVTSFEYYGENFSFQVPSPKHEGGTFKGRCTLRHGQGYEGTFILSYKGTETRGKASCHLNEQNGIYHLDGMFTLDGGDQQKWHASLHRIKTGA